MTTRSTIRASAIVFAASALALAAGILLRGCDEGLMTPVRAASQARYGHDGHAVLPDSSVTPGEADWSLTAEKLCAADFRTGTERHVTEGQKKRVCAEYGQDEGCPGSGFEIDHLISIELGGANSDANLWPQPVDAAGVIGFHAKDVVENRLHRLVCQGKLSLKAAQSCIADNWYGCAKKWDILPAPKE